MQPKLLLADEPTTNLDVTVQATTLRLMKTLQKESSSSIMLITHDMGIVAETADKVAVMYAGRVMEYCDTTSIFPRAQTSLHLCPPEVTAQNGHGHKKT